MIALLTGDKRPIDGDNDITGRDCPRSYAMLRGIAGTHFGHDDLAALISQEYAKHREFDARGVGNI